MAVGVLPRFDPSDPAVFGDPYPAYAQLRAAGPLARGLGGQWVLSGHAEISAVSRDRRMTKLLPPGYYESLMGIGPASAFLIRMQELFHNRAVTRLLGRAFTGRFTPQLTEHALTVARGLLAPAARDGRFDAVRDVGVPLPVEVVCELFGVPERDRELFRTSVAAMVAAFNDSVLTADPEVLAARRAAADAGVTALRACLAPLVDRARSEKGTDVLSVLASHLGDDGDPLADDVVIDSVIMSCYAGFETAMAMITTGLAVLAGKPGSGRSSARGPISCRLRSRSSSGTTRRSRSGCAGCWRRWRSAAGRSGQADCSCYCSARPTATNGVPATVRIGRDAEPELRTSPTAVVRTPASAPRWRGWRARWCCARCWRPSPRSPPAARRCGCRGSISAPTPAFRSR